MIGASVAIAIGYVLGLSWWLARGEALLEGGDLIPVRIGEVAVFLWLAVVGGSIGSFLNVVAWRVPRGLSIRGRSQCPRCATRLGAGDNIPVFGWLLLGGRCRTCRLPISARYPLVEAAVAASTVVVGVAEFYGDALPFTDRRPAWGPLRTPDVSAGLLATFLFHLVAISFAWAFGLIRWDGHRIPGGMLRAGCLAAAVPMLVYPGLMSVPWQVSVAPNWRGDGLYLDAWLRVATGGAAAVFFARGLARGFCPTADPKLDPLGSGTGRLIDLIGIVTLPALVIGWQSLSAVLILASLVARPLKRLGSAADALGQFAIGIPVAMAVQIAFWDAATSWSYWPGVGSAPAVTLAAAAVALLIPTWLGDGGPRSLPPRP